jgi:gas vesicle protein
MNDRIYYSRRAEELAKRQQTIGAVTFLALGLGIGAVLALLFAPNVGEKTRKLVTDALEEGFKHGQEAILDAANQLEREYPELRKRIESVLNRS